MRDLMDFCIYILAAIVKALFGLSLGGYSFGDFLVAVFVVSILVSSLVISFKRSGGSPGSAVRPTRSGRSKSDRPSKP